MELNEYQQKAMTTCMDSCDNFSYMMLNLVGEVGEFAGKVAKLIRKEELQNLGGDLWTKDGSKLRLHNEKMSFKDIDLLKFEAGDILWQLAGLCHVMGWELNEIAWMNLAKLQERKKIGTIDGSGDGIIRGK